MDNLAYDYELPYEVIDGQVFMLAAPSVNHSRIVRNLSEKFLNV